MAEFDDEFQFSAPSYHNFEAVEDEPVGDDGYFDLLRKSTIQKRVPAEEFSPSQNEFGQEEEEEEEEVEVSFAIDDEDGEAADAVGVSVTVVGEVVVTQVEAVAAAPTDDGAAAEEEEEEEEEDSNPAPPVAPPAPSASFQAQRKRKASDTSECRAKVTVPTTPNLRVVKRTRSERMLSSTSLELQKIQQEREQLKKQKEKYQKVFESVKTGAGPQPPPKSVKPLTQPSEITFHTDSRVRPEDEKAIEPFHSFAERVLAFCSSIGHSIKSAVAAPPAPPQPKLTVPVPFKLATDELAARRCPGGVASREEEEERLMREMKPFKARPVDPRIFSSAGDMGVARVARKPATVAEPFALEGERLHKRAVEEKEKEKEEAVRAPAAVSKSSKKFAAQAKTAASPVAPKSGKGLSHPLTPHQEAEKKTHTPGLAL